MYIKQIIIQGFKSYKEQTVIEPFSPGLNVVVGRNGSGKSNFFAAIRFVLGDAYTQMGREERQALMHEGSGSAVMSAYVEIIFDNSDGRFPTGKDELILRRTIGQKKDEYSLDRKNSTKTDVVNLLESAGFSRSNSYYIVPQGKVTKLTNMKDSERLDILKQVAGTQIYESRRSESLKIMTETNNKRTKIDETLDYINERLGQLEEEKDELRGYQEKDKERRCLEYTFHHREQIQIADALDELEETRQDGIENSDNNRQAFLKLETSIVSVDSKINKLHSQMELLKIDRRQLDEDRRESLKAKAKIELEVKRLSDGQSAADQARQRNQQETAHVREEIAKKEAELSKILPRFAKIKTSESDLKTKLDTFEVSRQRLYAKQGRGTQFKSKSDRDKWLRREIDELNDALATQKANRMDADEEVRASQHEILTTEEEINDLRNRLEKWSDNRQALSDASTGAREALERLSDERKVLQREEDKLESVTASARHEKEKAERTLSHTMDGPTAKGLASVRRLKRERGLTGAYGTIAELLQTNEHYRTAVEQTAGNSLFHYIVDNDDTATELIQALQKEHGGRVTFVPLNRLQSSKINYPNASDAIPLISKLQFDPVYEKAFEQVFGKTIICPNMLIGGQYARSHGLSAVTPEGDKTDKRGAMTGGFIDSRKSRLEAVRAVEKWASDYDTQREQAVEIRRQIERRDQEITVSVGELRKCERALQQMDDGFDPLRVELRNRTALLERHKDGLESKSKRKENVELMLKTYGSQVSDLEAELASDFKKTLTKEEETELETLNNSVQKLKVQWNELSKQRRALESDKNLLEVDLRENLRLKLDQFTSQAAGNSAVESAGSLKEIQRELQRANKTTSAIDSKIKENEETMSQVNVQLSDLQVEKTSKLHKSEDLAKTIESFEKRMEKYVSRKALLTTSAGECVKNIRDLGVLPEEAFEKYEKYDSKQVVSRLKKVNEALKKYKHVNKKAFEQYNSFTTQRETLIRRRKELDSSQKSIEDLVSVLDSRKDEAIERTFKQVSKEFATIFERLVPAGRGRLIIQRKADPRHHHDEDSGEDQRESVENYTGVGISVSFNSKHDEQQRIQQLSGGQKSLCALALVFAIQQCDPAPFYLFDEIDANLDAQYRTAVAQMLQEISEQQSTQTEITSDQPMSGQFICTTFRPEMVLVADKCYGVMFGKHKTSNIDVVARDKALEFVEGQKA